MMFAIMYIVFAKLLKIGNDIPHYPVYLLVGTSMWSFFTECTSQGMQSIILRGDLLRKISFPKYIVVVSATLTAIINMLINLVVVVIFALINGVTPSITWLLVPLSLIELYALSLGIAFLLGAINVKYRDVTSIWDVLIQAMFYCVPIIYPISMVADSSIIAAKIILLNPISQAVQDIRHNLITTDTITTWSYISTDLYKFIPIILIFHIDIINMNREIVIFTISVRTY
jgi:ABC-2 type transport system permease protein